MTPIVDGLRGRTRLALVFWGYCIAGTLVIGVLLFGHVSRVAMRFDPSRHHFLTAAVTGALFVASFLWAHISLWMCAFNARHPLWGYVARGYAVLAVVYYLIGVFGDSSPQSVTIWKVVFTNTQNSGCFMGRPAANSYCARIG